MEYLGWLIGGGGLALAIGFLLLYLANKKDQENYIIEKATPMPLSLVNVRDDVWLSGKAETQSPLESPHFHDSCLYYLYTLEEKVTETYVDSNGNVRTRTTWKERERDERSTLFKLVQGDLSIMIDGNRAEFRHCKNKSETLGKWRHTVYYFPYPGPVHAVGSVGEKKEYLEPYANIPLIVTTLDRQSFIEDAESSEQWLRRGGFFLLWAGGATLLYGLFDWFHYPVNTHGEFSTITLIYAIIPTTLFLMFYWALYTYNQLVTYHMRIENAWRQVDVDLKMRYDLIPNLVSTVKGYMAHEKRLLEDLVKLRNQAVKVNRDEKIELEDDLVNRIQTLVANVEKYPDIKAQPLVQKVMRELKAIEEKISHGRSIFNESVKEFNDLVQSFPHSLVAGVLGYQPRKYFAATEEERKQKRVHLS